MNSGKDLLKISATKLAGRRATSLAYRGGLPSFVFLAIVTAVAVAASSFPLIARSLWLDESMLLSNFFEPQNYNLLRPLGLYDQAVPPLVSLFLGAVTMLSDGNIIIIRISILAVGLAALIYSLSEARKSFGLITAGIIAVLAAGSYEFIYFSSEIKHYPFEMAGVHVLLGWMYSYSRRSAKQLLLSDVGVLAFGLALGFSTLFVFGGTLLTAALFSRPGNGARRHIVLIACLAMMGLFYKLLISYYSEFQIANSFDVYATTPGGHNLTLLLSLFNTSFPMVGVACGLAVSYRVMTYFLAPANVDPTFSVKSFFLFLSALLLFLTLTSLAGLYPASAQRHLLWLLPVAHATMAIAIGTAQPRRRIISWVFLMMLLLLQAFHTGQSLMRIRDFKEDTENGALYRELAAANSSVVLVTMVAQPSLEVYRREILALEKHTYVGLISNKTGPLINKTEYFNYFPDRIGSTPGAWGSTTYLFVDNSLSIYADWAASQPAPANNFFVLFSHGLKPVEDRILESLARRGCALTGVYEGRNVALMKASCSHAPV